MDDKIRYWLESARYDIITSKSMLLTMRYLYVGFMCHQIAEKSLKALIVSKGELPPETHELSKLADIAGLTDKLSEKQNNLINSISLYDNDCFYHQNIKQTIEAYNDDICKAMIIDTEKFFNWIAVILNKYEFIWNPYE